MHAVWILVTEWGGVLSFSMVTVENLYVPDKPAGILLSKYTMLQQRKITEVDEVVSERAFIIQSYLNHCVNP